MIGWKMATGNYVLGNNTRHYNWPKILLITALLSVLATAIIVPIAIVSSQQGTIDDNGDRISCFPLTGKKNLIQYVKHRQKESMNVCLHVFLSVCFLFRF